MKAAFELICAAQVPVTESEEDEPLSTMYNDDSKEDYVEMIDEELQQSLISSQHSIANEPILKQDAERHNQRKRL
mgnify:CR=1 FL=1|jgi:hypothetical protein